MRTLNSTRHISNDYFEQRDVAIVGQCDLFAEQKTRDEMARYYTCQR